MSDQPSANQEGNSPQLVPPVQNPGESVDQLKAKISEQESIASNAMSAAGVAMQGSKIRDMIVESDKAKAALAMIEKLRIMCEEFIGLIAYQNAFGATSLYPRRK